MRWGPSTARHPGVEGKGGSKGRKKTELNLWKEHWTIRARIKGWVYCQLLSSRFRRRRTNATTQWYRRLFRLEGPGSLETSGKPLWPFVGLTEYNFYVSKCEKLDFTCLKRTVDPITSDRRGPRPGISSFHDTCYVQKLKKKKGNEEEKERKKLKNK